MNHKIIPITSKLLNNRKIIHGFFTKTGNTKKEVKFNFNCSLKNKKHVKRNTQNRKLVAKFHNLELSNLKTVNQVHSNKVVIIDNEKQNTNNLKADALITKSSNVILGIITADCAPVFVFDPKLNIIAAVHVGWRGALNEILIKVITKFKSYESNLNDILISVGPCIGPKSYEVGKDFIIKFTKKDKNSIRFFNKINDRYLFNLPKYICNQVISIGIHKSNISLSEKDTFSNKELFYSYRRSIINNNPDEGRMINTISIRKT